MLRRFWQTTSGLVALAALLLGLTTVAIGAVAYEVTHEALEEQLDHRIATETAGLIAEAHGRGMPALALAIERRNAARSTASLEYLLVDRGGRIVAGSVAAQVPRREGFEEFFHYRHPDGGPERIGQALTTRVPGGTLVVAADRAGLEEIDRIIAALFAGGLTAMLAVGLGTAALIGWLTRSRLRRIDATAQAIIAGDLRQRIARDGSNSEFDRLAGTLNHMLERIEGLMDNLRQVSSDIADDLRTPLTRLYASLDRVSEEADPVARSARIEKARDQAAELLDIFAALLRISEIEGMPDRLPREPIDLSGLIEQMAETYRPDFEDSGRSLHVVAADGIRIEGERRLVSQALANLLDNGLRHTPPGTSVTLSAERVKDDVRVIVADDGPGVLASERDRLFHRFARGESARSTTGHGLGLAMVRAIAQAHSGDAVILDDLHGFAVEFRIRG